MASVHLTNSEPSVAEKPHLIFGAHAVESHTHLLVHVAETLHKRGFPVTFIVLDTYAPRLEAQGIHAIPYRSAVLDDPVKLAERAAQPDGMPRMLWDMKHIFTQPTGKNWGLLKLALANVTRMERDTKRGVVVVCEMGFLGANPLVLGAPLPEGLTVRPKVVHISSSPYLATSIDTGPFGLALPPDSTESGRARNMVIEAMMNQGPFAEVLAFQDQVMTELKTERPYDGGPLTRLYICQDLVLQTCPPSLEYKRSDLPSHVKFVGALSPALSDRAIDYPAWWTEVTDGKKQVVFVSQGTHTTVYEPLLIPALHALADCDEFLVVAVLGVKGATLPQYVKVPDNARVLDHFPYDAIFPYTSVFLTNGGWGGVLHAVTHGVPLVLAGATEDKPEVAMRCELAGIGINLRTGSPSEGSIKEAVLAVASKETYKESVTAMRQENEALDTIGLIEQHLLAMAVKPGN